MNITSLPFELQDLVYDFDGRYKTAMGRCLTLIKQRGQTPLGLRSDRWTHDISDKIMRADFSKIPEYYAELQYRIAKLKARLVPLEIKGWGVRGITDHLKRLPINYLFKDALGIYNVGMVNDSIMIDGITYKSTTKVNSVTLQEGSRVSGLWMRARGVETKVKCIDVLDPVFKKNIKGRKVKAYRELGVSENGIPSKDFYFKKIEIDGKKYFLDVRTRYVRVTRTTRVVGYLRTFNHTVYWYTPDKLPPK